MTKKIPETGSSFIEGGIVKNRRPLTFMGLTGLSNLLDQYPYEAGDKERLMEFLRMSERMINIILYRGGVITSKGQVLGFGIGHLGQFSDVMKEFQKKLVFQKSGLHTKFLEYDTDPPLDNRASVYFISPNTRPNIRMHRQTGIFTLENGDIIDQIINPLAMVVEQVRLRQNALPVVKNRRLVQEILYDISEVNSTAQGEFEEMKI